MNLPIGEYTLTWGDVTGWTRPVPLMESKTVVDAGSATFAGNYTQQMGTLSVTTTPVSGGITVDGTFKANGSWSGSVATGSHTVSFGSVSGYDTPTNQTVTVYYGQTTNVTGTYTQQLGSLTVAVGPQGAVDAGAKWRRVDTLTWLDSGSTETDVPVGPYDVEFKIVAGWRQYRLLYQ